MNNSDEGYEPWFGEVAAYGVSFVLTVSDRISSDECYVRWRLLKQTPAESAWRSWNSSSGSCKSDGNSDRKNNCGSKNNFNNNCGSKNNCGSNNNYGSKNKAVTER